MTERSVRLAAYGLIAASAIAGCRFAYDNPAERMLPGEIRGRAVQEREGEPGKFDPAEGTRVRLRGLPFVLDTRETGFFAFLDLPVGEYQVLLDTVVAGEHPRATQRRVQITLGSDGQPEGVTLGDVPLAFTASVSGRVIDEDSGKAVPFATVVDDVSLLSVTADENGDFHFPSLSLGNHVLRAAGSVQIDDDTTRPLVGGTVSVTLERSHERGTLAMTDHIVMRDATGRGRVQMEVGLMTPGRPPFGLDEIAVKATSCDGKRVIELQPPSSNGQVDDPEVPEGCWNIRLHPPEGPQSAEFSLQTGVRDVLVIADADVALGKLLLVSASSLTKSRLACNVDADCGGDDVCNAGQCAAPPPPSDPCAVGNGGCSAEATCSNVEGLSHCSCSDGYEDDGRSCRNVNECVRGLDDCSDDARCTDTVGSYECACEDGFVGDGFVCVDVDECEEGLHDCSDDATCTNTPGAWTCECNDGYSGDGTSCTNVDECLLALDACDANATCSDTIGGYECACDEGFTGDGFSCDDLNECVAIDPQTQSPLHLCDANAVCGNTVGGYECACEEGYDGDGFVCEDVDECVEGTHACDPNATCTNTVGSYACECEPGFVGDGFTCEDVDECTELDPQTEAPLHSCDVNAACTNTSGSYECACEPGHTGDGFDCVPAFVQIAAGGLHTCGVTSDGSLWCWGDNSQAQLGAGVDAEESGTFQVQQQGLSWKKVFARDSATCALDQTDRLWCWGDNNGGALGLGYDWMGQTVSVPTLVTDSDLNELTWRAIALANFTSCGVTLDGRLLCWGGSDAFPSQHLSPESDWIDVVGTLGDFADSFCGTREIPGVDEEAATFEVWCWGDNSGDQFGAFQQGMAQVISDSASQPEILLAHGAFCSIDPADRTLWCRGAGFDDTEQVSETAWTTVVSGYADAIEARSFCGIGTDGVVRCWGRNQGGVTGTGTFDEPVVFPTPVVGNLQASTLDMSSMNACAVTPAGELQCWGVNFFNALAFPGYPAVTSPERVGVESDWRSVTTGSGNTCGIRSDGSLWCWGNNESSRSGQSDDFPFLLTSMPVAPHLEWAGVSLGGSAGCGIDVEGGLWCWGERSQFSLSSGLEREPVPVKPESTFLAVSMGASFVCAIDSEHRLWCGGPHGFVETQQGDALPGISLGGVSNQGEAGDDWEHIAPLDIGDWTHISVGQQHACGLKGGALYCFGSNVQGQLGDGTPFTREGLVEVLIPESQQPTWVSLSVGGYASCAIDADGRLWCWGDNGAGQMGYEPLQQQGEIVGPVEVGEAGWSSVSAGDLHTCGVREDQTGWCWGVNELSASLGVGHVGPAYGLQQLEGAWQEINASAMSRPLFVTMTFESHTCGRRPDDSLWCWGGALSGQTGEGVLMSTVPRRSLAGDVP